MSTPEYRAEKTAYMRDWIALNSNRDRVNAQRRARYHANPEHILAAQHEYNARPDVQERQRVRNRIRNAMPSKRARVKVLAARPEAKDKKREQDKSYRDCNLAAVRAAANARYHANPKTVIDRNRAWRQKNPDKILAKNQRRRAAKANVIVHNVSSSWLYERDGGRCGLCGGFIERNAITIDHIIPLVLGGDHVETNLQIAHRSCNSSKGAKLLAA